MALRRIRLASGLVLFAWLLTHFTNHALGLVSLAAADAGRQWTVLIWRNPVGTAALYAALLTHLVLALVALWRRRHLRMPAWEATQLTLGLAIPLALAGHVVGTRVAAAAFGVDDTYARVVLGLWLRRPDLGLAQAVLVVVAWVHACIGLHYWLRLRPRYRRLGPLLLGAAVLLPTLALLGFVQAGREVEVLARDPAWVASVLPADRIGPEGAAWLTATRDAWLGAFGLSLAGVLLARAVRWRIGRRTAVTVAYPGGREVAIPGGATVLEASRLARIPHASVCGGRGRCSTCRVRVVQGLDALPPPSAAERRVLERIGAPPGVRLACQARPTRRVGVVPLLPATASPRDARAAVPPGVSREREIAVLFADLRRFTGIAERRLPYDVVFLLNRYFEVVGGAIAGAGGIANQFTGDGVMALFGVDSGPEDGCRRAIAAAAEMVRGLAGLSELLAEELPGPLRIGIGIHAGPAVVGIMGYGATTYLTAVGDTVHVASRLQELTKQYDCQAVVSGVVAAHAGLDTAGLPRHELTVRNRAEPIAIHVVDDVARLRR